MNNLTINNQDIKNFLIDFGGVLYEIDIQKGFDSLLALSKMPAIENFNYGLFPIIKEYEKGKIDSKTFFRNMSDELKLDCTSEDFSIAWNSILIKQNVNSLRFIKELRKFGNVYLLSNTNDIHYNCFATQCTELFRGFNKLYFSYKIGRAKPDSDFFEYCLSDIGTTPEQCLFFDDSPPNIESASNMKIPAVLISRENTIFDWFDNFKSNKEV